ncbi:MAG: phosphate ABC transporter ATP-binding protein [Dehalococcoidia bacterium]|nr:phosphate ABC transporter ATP-binding protein [Dehalococcoidia bacterium]
MSTLAPAQPSNQIPLQSTSSQTQDKLSIRARDLNLWYGDFQALKDVNIDIRKGVITGLIGPSGCGKTTLLRCFNRINERYENVKTTGNIEILDKNIYDADVTTRQLRRRIGMVFQRPNPLPISIFDNVLFGSRIHAFHERLKRSERAEVVEQALKQVDLWATVKDKLKSRATSLTLEQQQKLCIARLIPLKPDVILMDEPCSALDAEGIEKVENLIESLRDDYTVVVVTHNMAQARRATDECIFMLLGEIIEHTSTADMFLNPREKQTEMYIQGRYG